ncbi:hypothetical protein Pla22_03020 [Rubripirellula amarantea]|uniref:Uncharacterized protein n=1 Tax=Rubripirellula amarantea TaxID=2527999 RepID=A0A5C5WPK7_9BACT|nr:hypothetical protein Pla22_03020 [Rubripirellula amarantea]
MGLVRWSVVASGVYIDPFTFSLPTLLYFVKRTGSKSRSLLPHLAIARLSDYWARFLGKRPNFFLRLIRPRLIGASFAVVGAYIDADCFSLKATHRKRRPKLYRCRNWLGRFPPLSDGIRSTIFEIGIRTRMDLVSARISFHCPWIAEKSSWRAAAFRLRFLSWSSKVTRSLRSQAIRLRLGHRSRC